VVVITFGRQRPAQQPLEGTINNQDEDRAKERPQDLIVLHVWITADTPCDAQRAVTTKARRRSPSGSIAGERDRTITGALWVHRRPRCRTCELVIRTANRPSQAWHRSLYPAITDVVKFVFPRRVSGRRVLGRRSFPLGDGRNDR